MYLRLKFFKVTVGMRLDIKLAIHFKVILS